MTRCRDCHKAVHHPPDVERAKWARLVQELMCSASDPRRPLDGERLVDVLRFRLDGGGGKSTGYRGGAPVSRSVRC